MKEWLEQQRYILLGHIKSPFLPAESADCENMRFKVQKKTYQTLCRIYSVAVPHVVHDSPQNTTGSAVLELQNCFQQLVNSFYINKQTKITNGISDYPHFNCHIKFNTSCTICDTSHSQYITHFMLSFKYRVSNALRWSARPTQ